MNRSTAEWRMILDEKDRQITYLQQQVDWLMQQAKLAKSQRFGISSEQTSELLNQLSMFEEREAMSGTELCPPEPQHITYRRKKQKGKRELDFSGLPTERIVHELPDDERICNTCGGLLHACGESVSRRELTFIPARYKVTEHVQTVYSCRQCERTGDRVPMKKSSVSNSLIPGSGIASPSLMAHILNSKYVLALPLYRQEQEFKRMDIPLSRQTMANWVIAIHDRYLAPLFNTLHKELLKNAILHADETTLMVLREPGRTAKQKSYVWLYSTSGDAKRPVVLYDYQPSRAGECASSFLAGFSGKIHTDGYDVYHCKLSPEVTVVGCWAHMRRKFTDALKILPRELRSTTPASMGLSYCNKLFELEAKYAEQGLSYEERYCARIKHSKPVAEGQSHLLCILQMVRNRAKNI